MFAKDTFYTDSLGKDFQNLVQQLQNFSLICIIDCTLNFKVKITPHVLLFSC